MGLQPFNRGRNSVSQREKVFSPHVLPIPVGSSVEFPNDDLIFHNVFSLSRPGPFDLGLYRAGTTRSLTFTSAAAIVSSATSIRRCRHSFCPFRPHISPKPTRRELTNSTFQPAAIGLRHGRSGPRQSAWR